MSSVSAIFSKVSVVELGLLPASILTIEFNDKSASLDILGEKGSNLHLPDPESGVLPITPSPIVTTLEVRILVTSLKEGAPEHQAPEHQSIS